MAVGHQRLNMQSEYQILRIVPFLICYLCVDRSISLGLGSGAIAPDLNLIKCIVVQSFVIYTGEAGVGGGAKT